MADLPISYGDRGCFILVIGAGNAPYALGFDLTLACPEGYDPDAKILARAKTNANVRVVRDPAEAADKADVINTDVWASMGQEEEQKVARKRSPDSRLTRS